MQMSITPGVRKYISLLTKNKKGNVNTEQIELNDDIRSTQKVINHTIEFARANLNEIAHKTPSAVAIPLPP